MPLGINVVDMYLPYKKPYSLTPGQLHKIYTTQTTY